MAAVWKVTLDRAGVGRILKGPATRRMVNAAGQRAAAAARSALPAEYAGDIRLDEYTTDRGAAAVVLAHPAARGIEAKYGPLGRAAGAAGGEFRGGGR